eukprot:CAMPEP_0205806708 /NCGR_PEP_ID=MMETSP0205-20121125/10345_1 /ASSEMBLY_ACC=CAM_ASM_000278 /TAXON_ID=36767 /ORGANISM="Euplotes focardii, Strain TN1" /LENGTH=161 /DNA_ID=CAMNT_0053080023 /DNA_START=27 /DNA_END=512 /DNA_ORIENTATION=+
MESGGAKFGALGGQDQDVDENLEQRRKEEEEKERKRFLEKMESGGAKFGALGGQDQDVDENLEQRRKEEEEKERKRFLENNENKLLKNDITNCDIFRTLLFHFKTDNELPIDGCAKFVANLLKRPHITQDDEDADTRFFNSLVRIMKNFSFNGKTITERKF